MKRIFIILLALFISVPNSFSQDTTDAETITTVGTIATANKATTATILALNKITAKHYTYNVKIGESIAFERLHVQVLSCWKSSPDEVPENKALLKIDETQVNKKDKRNIFYGWMFSSSPSLSSLEHPTYDIALMNCSL